MISIFSNTLGNEELAAVKECFDSRWLGRGKKCAEFEQAFSEYIGAPVLLFNSCTAATFTLIKALGIGPGAEVLIPSIQFLGVANAVVAAGARPVFCDVDPHTLAILPEEIEKRRTSKTRAVFLLHYGGHPAPMDGIEDVVLCSELLLEDAANAVASTYDGIPCGAMGDGGVWSFDSMKELVMGDGGALHIQDPQIRKRAYELRYFGLPPKDNSGIDASANRDRWWEFQLDMTTAGRHTSNDIAAGIGLVQLGKLPGFIERRREIWDAYQERLADVVLTPPEPRDGTTSSYYLYWIQTKERDDLARHLLDSDIYTTFRYYPLHLVRAYEHCGGRLPNAEQAAETMLCLPLHQNLSDSDVNKVIDTVRGYFRR